MKKIILVLLMVVSFSFAFTFSTYYVANGNIYKLNSNYYVNSATCTNDYPPGYAVGVTKYTLSGSTYTAIHYEADPNAGTVNSICYKLGRAGASYYTSWGSYYLDNTSCASPKQIVDGECISPVTDNNTTCDPLGSQFKSSTTGKCVDCMPFLTVSGRGHCACDAIGSTYSGTTGVTYYYNTGNYTYKRTKVTCDNGNQIAIYTDPVANSNTTPDTNSTSDNNTTQHSDNNTTTGTTTPDNNTTTTPTTADANATVKAISDAQTATTNALKTVDTSVQAVKSSVDTVNNTLTQSNFKLDSVVSQLKSANSLSTDMKTIQTGIQSGVTATNTALATTNSALSTANTSLSSIDARLKNLIDITLPMTSSLNDISSHTAATTTAVNAQGSAITSAVNGTTSAINTQGDKLNGKMDDLIKAVKDGNGTDMTATNDKLDTLHQDVNSSNSLLSKIRDDTNQTSSLLSDIKGYFENNNSYQTPDLNSSDFSLSDLIPDESWFQNNSLDLHLNNYGGDCYCETAEIVINGKTFYFPPQELLDMIPFNVVANIFMAFVYLLGLKSFLRDE